MLPAIILFFFNFIFIYLIESDFQLIHSHISYVSIQMVLEHTFHQLETVLSIQVHLEPLGGRVALYFLPRSIYVQRSVPWLLTLGSLTSRGLSCLFVTLLTQN